MVSPSLSNPAILPRSYIRFSIILHLVFFLLLFLGETFFSRDIIVIPPSVQIEMVALPDLVKNRGAPVKVQDPIRDIAPRKSPPPPKKADRMKLSTRKKTKKSNLGALRNFRKKVQKKNKKLLERKKKELERLETNFRRPLKGNQLHQGSSSSGERTKILDKYLGYIRGKIQSNWTIPPYLESKNLKATVRLYIDAQGKIRYSLKESSGNKVFDTQVKESLEKSNPFDAPPVDMRMDLMKRGLDLGFPL